MTDHSQPAFGTVVEEAARLIEAMATMARSNSSSSPYAGGPAEPFPPAAPDDADAAEDSQAPGGQMPGAPTSGACSACGVERDGTPAACRICPLCQAITLLRSVRPETVDRLADIVAAVAASLRDVAAQSRGSSSAPDARSGSARPPDRSTVQDIPVDDENEG